MTKKGKRASLLLAGTTSLLTLLLVPTVLASCSAVQNDINNSTTEDNNNNNNNTGTNPVKIGNYKSQVEKLNESNNLMAGMVYDTYIEALKANKNRKTTVSKPVYEAYKFNKSFADIVKDEQFFNELIEMFQAGLEVGSQSNQITQPEMEKLVNEMQANIADIVSSSKFGSSAFEFKNSEEAVWTYTNGSTKYQLYLDTAVEFSYEYTEYSINVHVKNVAKSSDIKSKLVVTDGSSTSQYYFKTNEDFKLPASLLSQFTDFFITYDNNATALREHIKNRAFDFAGDLVRNTHLASTIWNQFVLSNGTKLKSEIQNDLNKAKQNSRVLSWIKTNTEASEVLTNLENDIRSSSQIEIELAPLLVRGQGEDNIENPWTLKIKVNNATTYVLSLHAEAFRVNPTYAGHSIGYKVNALDGNPTIKFGPRSSLTKLVNGTKTSAKLKTDKYINVEALYDFKNEGLSFFLYNFFLNEINASSDVNLKLTETLAKKENLGFISKFRDYLYQDQNQVTEYLKQPDNLVDFILSNIDLKNTAMHTKNTLKDGDVNAVPDKDFELFGPNGTTPYIGGWRGALNRWLRGAREGQAEDKSKQPVITVNPMYTGNLDGTDSSKLARAAAIKITTREGSNWRLDFGHDYLTYTSIYIFLGTNSTQGVDPIVNAGLDQDQPFGTFNVDIKQPAEITQASKKDVPFETFFNNVKDNFAIVLEKWTVRETDKTPPFYAFYMGQEMIEKANKEKIQTKFPVVLDSLIQDPTKFAKTLLNVDLSKK